MVDTPGALYYTAGYQIHAKNSIFYSTDIFNISLDFNYSSLTKNIEIAVKVDKHMNEN